MQEDFARKYPGKQAKTSQSAPNPFEENILQATLLL
jgi:hypothetical protein